MTLDLLQDYKNWDETLQEAVLSRSPQKIRELFAVMLVFCQMDNSLKLWEKHKDSISEDVARQTEGYHLETEVKQHQHLTYNMFAIAWKLRYCYRRSLRLAYTFPRTDRIYFKSRILERNMLQHNNVTEYELLLNDQQKKAYEQVIRSVVSATGTVFFLADLVKHFS